MYYTFTNANNTTLSRTPVINTTFSLKILVRSNIISHSCLFLFLINPGIISLDLTHISGSFHGKKCTHLHPTNQNLNKLEEEKIKIFHNQVQNEIAYLFLPAGVKPPTRVRIGPWTPLNRRNATVARKPPLFLFHDDFAISIWRRRRMRWIFRFEDEWDEDSGSKKSEMNREMKKFSFDLGFSIRRIDLAILGELQNKWT